MTLDFRKRLENSGFKDCYVFKVQTPKREALSCWILRFIRGLVAQLGERCVRNAEAEGSIPFESTKKDKHKKASLRAMSS